MWSPDQIVIEEAEGSEMIVLVRTPAGSITIMGAVDMVDGVLTIEKAHIQGLAPGRLSRSGLNAIGYRILEVTGADSLVLQGGTRSTGRNPGRPPRGIRFPRQAASLDDGAD